ncbi:MAG: histidine phosphotransferase family protein [Caulobacteraceae bacterium]|nr:histidine phosphotransferase family protein [Caulobacteraceae bacterium]
MTDPLSTYPPPIPPQPASPLIGEPAAEPRAKAPKPAEAVGASELAAFLAARLCHDFISPAGAIVSGLDLLEDPSAQDMREDAMSMIAASARKLVAQIKFNRVAFGGSQAAEVFDTRELENLAQGVFADTRANLEWGSLPPGLDKAPAKSLLNLVQVGAGALPTGGLVRVDVAEDDAHTEVVVLASGRARLRSEVLEGLRGDRLSDGRTGHWVQAYYLNRLIDEAGGVLEIETGEASVTLRCRFPR